jgi:hypothetical protein
MNQSISLSSRVAINGDVLCRDLDGELVLLDLRTGVYFSLDPLGTRVWLLAQGGHSLAEVVRLVVKEYEVTPERFTADLVTFVSALREKGLVEVEAAASR